MTNLRVSVFFVALLVTCNFLAAQPAIFKAPEVGNLLQQLKQFAPSVSFPDGADLIIENENGRSAKIPFTKPFLVSQIRITHNTLFDTPTLMALVADGVGKMLTLKQVSNLASRLTKHYRANGYPLSRAIIPAQTITGGLVRIELIETVYGKIDLVNSSRVRDTMLQSALSGLHSGEAVDQVALDRTLLLMSDLPGLDVESTFSPGEAVGTSNLSVVTTASKSFTGDVSIDNYGNIYAGAARASGSIKFHNPLRVGDTLTVAGLHAGNGLNYARVGYELMQNGQGTRAGASYSALNYTLGGIFAQIGESGSAKVTSLWASHPLLRSRKLNLYGQLQFDRLLTRSQTESLGLEVDSSLDSWTLSLEGDARNALFRSGLSSWKIGVTQGQAVQNEASLSESSTDLSGNFSRLNVNIAQLKRISSKNSFYAAYAGQWASTNLVGSQKMSIGGPYTVRAYPVGALAGDTAHLLSVEWRHELGQAFAGQWQAVAFIDTAHVQLNKSTSAQDLNTATMNGAGIGLNWTGEKHWSVRGVVAMPLGSISPLINSEQSPRGWLELRTSF